MEAHTTRAHALLSASGSSRWLNCTPSPRLEEKIPEPESSVYAAEGTVAHEYAEAILLCEYKHVTLEEFHQMEFQISSNDLYTDDMLEYVQVYVAYVKQQFKVAQKRSKGAVLLIEKRVDLTEYIQEGFGSCDVIIIADEVMEVIDLKYGKGIKVEAKGNSQLQLYGLGALRAYDMLYDIINVRLTIVQPRLDHISGVEVNAEQLKAWGEGAVKTKAEQAFKGEGELCSGSWCKWCKVKGTCPALAKEMIETLRVDFHSEDKPTIDLLDDDELLNIFSKIPRITDWVGAVSSHVLTEAVNGKKWKGFKLVEGRSVRMWNDPEKVIETLKRRKFRVEQIINSRLKGIGAIEKLLGKKKFSILDNYVSKPEGKATLVPASDKRPELGNITEDFK